MGCRKIEKNRGKRNIACILGDWAALDKPGQNGFLSVLAVLSWWGQSLLCDSVPTDFQWLAACDDILWVLNSMLESVVPHTE